MKRVVAVVVLTLIASLVTWTPAQAWTCPPATVGGPTIAEVNVGKKTVPVKSVTYKKGGTLDPPATNKAAGLSKRNAPLHAKHGSTVITWHVRYGPGCPGALNRLITMPLGSTFTVGKIGKTPKAYEITERIKIKQTGLKSKWFRRDGTRQLVLITCADLVGGVFTKTTVIIAKPVPIPPPAPAATTTDPAPQALPAPAPTAPTS